MNLTNFSSPVSVEYVSSTCSAGVKTFAQTWAESVELRVVTFALVMLCCVMLWVTCLVREVTRTAVTVLCKLLVFGYEASGERHTHIVSKPERASQPHIRHKTDGGPPPIPHPSDVAYQDSAA